MLAQNIIKYNPIDDIESIFHHRQYALERRSANEVAIEISGKWSDMALFFAWEEQMNCLHISCLIDIESDNVPLPSIFELLALLNEDIWVGYFSYWEESGMPVFRHSVFIDGSEIDFSRKLAQIINIAITECERAYPVFHAVLKQHIAPRRALLPFTLM